MLGSDKVEEERKGDMYMKMKTQITMKITMNMKMQMNTKQTIQTKTTTNIIGIISEPFLLKAGFQISWPFRLSSSVCMMMRSTMQISISRSVLSTEIFQAVVHGKVMKHDGNVAEDKN